MPSNNDVTTSRAAARGSRTASATWRGIRMSCGNLSFGWGPSPRAQLLHREGCKGAGARHLYRACRREEGGHAKMDAAMSGGQLISGPERRGRRLRAPQQGSRRNRSSGRRL
ncbi:hypothetical protein HPB50_027387 [Hyalomma asiaticum]|uniref:Uncharacterized protein n=1 Tax=Hyalomma asiaticum TaxID=266040 RepID=A0ACB7TV72_HYAAI|nr:hypothetical protein HPB50_027387 [Hyalomma asiaticum]